MKKRFLLATLVSVVCGAQLALAATLLPNTPPECNNVQTWLKANGDTVIATPARIKAMNKTMLSDTMCDLTTYPTTISGSTLSKYINHYEMNYDQYVNGSSLSRSTADALLADAKGTIPASTTVRYCVVSARSDLRSFPTLLRAFDSPGDVNFDNWQETAVDPGEAALILHQNAKGNFYFVQLKSYRGWLPANKVALTDRKTFLEFADPKDFGVVTEKLLTVSGAGSSSWLYQMGSKIPLSPKGRVLLPFRSSSGQLSPVEMPAPWNEGLHKGYLPYTSNNLVTMAFKHLGAPYGWGGMHNSVDCSAFAQDVYKTMGIELPRNGDEQENAWHGTNLKGLGWNDRDKIIKTLPTGTLFFTPYHVMIYLGLYKNRPYMIHALGSYGAPDGNGGFYKNRILQVVVSDVYLRGGSGTSLMMQMTKANSYK